MNWAEPIYFEYTKAANIHLPPIKAMAMHRETTEHKTCIIPIDLSTQLQTAYTATSPACLVSFINIFANDTLNLVNNAVSNLFVIINGNGVLDSDFGQIKWQEGDIIAIPHTAKLNLSALVDATIYWVTDEPLVKYLGVKPAQPIFDPVHFPYTQTKQMAASFNQEVNAKLRNRNGVLLANPKCLLTKTITPTLWALYNVIGPKTVQNPHQHNSVALDLCFSAGENVYTLMSKEIDSNGNLVNPIRMDWKPGAAFITPPAWWHSHHNESDVEAVVIPIQDAGIYTYLRTLFIKFAGASPTMDE